MPQNTLASENAQLTWAIPGLKRKPKLPIFSSLCDYLTPELLLQIIL